MEDINGLISEFMRVGDFSNETTAAYVNRIANSGKTSDITGHFIVESTLNVNNKQTKSVNTYAYNNAEGRAKYLKGFELLKNLNSEEISFSIREISGNKK